MKSSLCLELVPFSPWFSDLCPQPELHQQQFLVPNLQMADTVAILTSIMCGSILHPLPSSLEPLHDSVTLQTGLTEMPAAGNDSDLGILWNEVRIQPEDSELGEAYSSRPPSHCREEQPSSRCTSCPLGDTVKSTAAGRWETYFGVSLGLALTPVMDEWQVPPFLS